MLPTPSELIHQTWQAFRQNPRRWLAVSLCLFLPRLALTLFGLGSVLATQIFPLLDLPTSFLVLVVWILGLLFFAWSALAMVAASARTPELSLSAVAGAGASVTSPPLGQLFRETKPLVFPTIVATFLASLLIALGGFFLIIPGVIFLVWYFFVPYAIVIDGARGSAALRQSKALVIGRWWAIAWRLLVSHAVFILGGVAIQVVLSVLFASLASSPLSMRFIDNHLAVLTVALTTPFTVFATARLYQAAKGTAPAGPAA